MSRIGKQIVNIPDKVELKLNGMTLSAKGPKGNLERTFSDKLNINIENKEVKVEPKNAQDQESRALWGLTRSLIFNMVHGVSEGFTKDLEFNGVGYRASVSGKTLNLNLGYSHPIEYALPDGIEAKVNKNTISISGASKELVGLVAAQVRSKRPPEPYKGKGIKYATERIIRKAGKTGAKK